MVIWPYTLIWQYTTRWTRQKHEKAVEWFRTPPVCTKPETSYTKYIYDLDIPKDKHIKL